MLPAAYKQFKRKISSFIPGDDIITDPLWILAYGTDASFYRLTPKIVVNVATEPQVIKLLEIANQLKLPVTFRAAGTSLSGQSITDSILLRLTKGWRDYQILEQGARIRLQPGVIGEQANRWLASYQRKIGPDPASIDTAQIGGILANNASGMCCGVAQNSYQTLDAMKIILIDGIVVDTADKNSRTAFAQTHGTILEQLVSLRKRILADQHLTSRIRHKFKIKNTTGYSLNALLDFEDPFEIMQHLMIGSEGTLGFIAEVIYKTVVEHQHKASALILFPDMKTACQAIPVLKQEPVEAAELMDRASLHSVENKPGLPTYLKTLSDGVTALLVETRAVSAEELHQQTEQIVSALEPLEKVFPVQFTDLPEEYSVLWNIRKGLFPAVGAVRKTGTTVIIEDVAFPVESLAAAALDLQDLFLKYGYGEAIIFGHAFEGNLHFCFTQDFSTESEVNRYRDFIADVVGLVVDRYDGSLKAEHGTGRNMAPFVEKEWGKTAFALMQEIKSIFDPEYLLNPGVILNDDAEVHIKNLKPLPATSEIVDKCIECGFCEPVCPSKDLTFTPRHRIVGRREISRQLTLDPTSANARQLIKSYQYAGSDTCATDGLCASRCPVGIDTGKLVKQLRQENNSTFAQQLASWTGAHFGLTTTLINRSISLLQVVHRLFGSTVMRKTSQLARALSGRRIPAWNQAMPSGVPQIEHLSVNAENPLQVVYFPSCASRSLGNPGKHARKSDALPQTTISLLKKAGYEIILPENLDNLCCGQVYESKGFGELADLKRHELFVQLWEASAHGKYPVLFDTSPCLSRLKEGELKSLKVYEPIEFVLQFLRERLDLRLLNKKIALHLTCSSRKMGLEMLLISLAKQCAREVVVPEQVYCCGFAGDRGFSFPELNASALRELKRQVSACEEGYSTSVTCEIGLTLHGGIPYRSILYLVDEASG